MKPIAITMGDPAGIGPEIIAQAYAAQPELTRGSFVVGNAMMSSFTWKKY